MNNSIDLERQATINLEKQFNDYVVYVDYDLDSEIDYVITAEHDQITVATFPNTTFKGEISYIQDKKIYEEILSEFYDHIANNDQLISVFNFRACKDELIKTFIEK